MKEQNWRRQDTFAISIFCLFDRDIKKEDEVLGGEGKPSNAFNISASLGRFSVFSRAQKTIVSENSQAPSSVYNILGIT